VQIKEDQLIAEAYIKQCITLFEDDRLSGSLFTSNSQKIPQNTLWHGTCNVACRGAWTSVDPFSPNNIQEHIKGSIEGCSGYGDQKQLLYDAPQYDMNDNEEHKYFPLECYLPRSKKEFLAILNKNGFVRYYDGEWFNVFCKDQKKCKQLIEQTLNAMDEWLPGGVDF